MIAPLREAELEELGGWAEELVDAASGWAERAEVSAGARRELTRELDAIASKARYISSMTNALARA